MRWAVNINPTFKHHLLCCRISILFSHFNWTDDEMINDSVFHLVLSSQEISEGFLNRDTVVTWLYFTLKVTQSWLCSVFRLDFSSYIQAETAVRWSPWGGWWAVTQQLSISFSLMMAEMNRFPSTSPITIRDRDTQNDSVIRLNRPVFCFFNGSLFNQGMSLP